MGNILIVKGRTVDNIVFRPSDWVERVAACCASYSSDRRLRYQQGLKPVLVENEKYLSIHLSLEFSHPEIWHFVMGFIASNDLMTFTQKDEYLTMTT